MEIDGRNPFNQVTSKKWKWFIGIVWAGQYVVIPLIRSQVKNTVEGGVIVALIIVVIPLIRSQVKNKTGSLGSGIHSLSRNPFNQVTSKKWALTMLEFRQVKGRNPFNQVTSKK